MTSSNKIRFDMTCSACPEQYDAYLGDEQVGYLRLRHGTFRVDVPDCAAQTIYTAHPQGDGCFASKTERDHYLRRAAKAILDWVAAGRPGPGQHKESPPPDVEYELTNFSEPFGDD